MQTLMPTIRPTMLVPGIGGFTIGSRLWDVAGFRPSLDLQLADTKSLVDATTGAQLVTFTRASSGTFVGSDGVLQTAVTNLITNSQVLNAANWLLGAGATLAATTDVPAPDGSLTAWTLTSSGAAAQVQAAITGISGASYAGSLFIRRRSGTGTINIRVAENTNTALSGVTSDWQRFSFVATSTTTTIRVGINLSGIVDAVDIWGAQLEQSSTVGEYIPTTSAINSAPRFDHNPTTGESLGLLVEEQRTNLLQRSEEFDNASWTASNATVTANQLAAPNGTVAADLVTGTVNSVVGVSQSPSIASASYCFSVYAKAGTETWLRLFGPAATNNAAWFNLATGTVGTVQASVTASIATLLDGWYRCSIVSTGNGSCGIRTAIADGNTAGSNGGNLYLWGAQLEAGAFPTSYIPTTTATVTRSADVASISGSNFSSWYRQDEGTFFASANIFNFDTNMRGLLGLDTGSFARGYAIGALVSGTNRVRAIRRDATNSPNIGDVTVQQGALSRVAAFFNSSESLYSCNGSAIQSNTIVLSLSPMSDLRIGWQNISGTVANNYCCGPISRITYWPTRLSNSTLQSITQ
jgi:hypothetical protein